MPLPKYRRERTRSRNVVRFAAVVVTLIQIIRSIISLHNITPLSYLSSLTLTQDRRLNDESYCNRIHELKLHERGHWEHHYLPQQPLNSSIGVHSAKLLSTLHKTPQDSNQINIYGNDKYLQQLYFPQELNWMAGYDWPETLFRVRGDDPPIMYRSRLGNQGGSCGRDKFQPSLSMWIPADVNNSSMMSRINKKKILSPSLRLIERLARSKKHNTLCMLGDSIDFQFYDALRYNIMRQQTLQNDINISMSDTIFIPVNYTNGTHGTGVPPYMGWMTMTDIQETKISLRYNNDDHDSSMKHTAVFRYYQSYGWSPWSTLFMDDCNIVTYNLGLHYRMFKYNDHKWFSLAFPENRRFSLLSKL